MMMMMMMARRRWSDTARRRVHRRSAMAMTTRASATRRINPFVGSRTNVSRGKSSVKRTTRRVAATAGESEVFRAWDQATKSEKRTDIKKIMILGAGPIVIGQVRGDTRDRGGGGGGRPSDDARNGAGTRRWVVFEKKKRIENESDRERRRGGCEVSWMGRCDRENAGRILDAWFSFVCAILTFYARVDANSIGVRV